MYLKYYWGLFSENVSLTLVYFVLIFTCFCKYKKVQVSFFFSAIGQNLLLFKTQSMKKVLMFYGVAQLHVTCFNDFPYFHWKTRQKYSLKNMYFCCVVLWNELVLIWIWSAKSLKRFFGNVTSNQICWWRRL